MFTPNDIQYDPPPPQSIEWISTHVHLERSLFMQDGCEVIKSLFQGSGASMGAEALPVPAFHFRKTSSP